MGKLSLGVSIVIYCTRYKEIEGLIQSCYNQGVSSIYIIDNSPADFQFYEGDNVPTYITVIKTGINLGYGAAHNIAIKKSIESNSKYHLILNPDIYFEKDIFENIYNFMESNLEVGLVMPKILYPDGSIQHLCKLLPDPFDLMFRRFLPFKKIIEKRNEIYELRFSGYDKIMDVPYLSGCFMFMRTKIFEKVGFFDERFFMYIEDTDLTRRIHRFYRTVYYPKAQAYHHYQKGSYKNFRLMMYNVKSAIKYFLKWGFFFDRERRKINKKILEKLNYRKRI